MRILVLIVIISLNYLPLNAKVGVSAGARAGFNVANLIKFDAPGLSKKKPLLGSDIAALLRLDFNKYVGLQMEVEFTQKGQAWSHALDSLKYYGKFVANYIQFPVLAVATYGSTKVKGVFLFGPYFAYWTGGYMQNSIRVDNQTRYEDHHKFEFTSNEVRFDVGLTSGIGADFKVGKGCIELMSRYNIGCLSTAKKIPDLKQLYNSNFSLSVGYRYSIQ